MVKYTRDKIFYKGRGVAGGHKVDLKKMSRSEWHRNYSEVREARRHLGYCRVNGDKDYRRS